MNNINIARDFISDEKRNYKVKVGGLIASSLSGFICGIIVASIIWIVVFQYYSLF